MSSNPMRKFKRFLHKVRLCGALLVGVKPSRMSRLVDSTIYELRILTVTTILVIGFYSFEIITEDPNKSSFDQLAIKINFGILLLIIFLVFKVLIKINKKSSIGCNLPSAEDMDTCPYKQEPIDKSVRFEKTYVLKSKTNINNINNIHSQRFESEK